MNAMRLEKGYRAMGSELTTERTPTESGLGFLVRHDHDFVGKDAMLARDQNNPWRMVLLELEKSDDVQPYHTHTIFEADQPIGIVTSAAYGFRTDKSLALAYLRPEATGKHMKVRVLGRDLAAKILDKPPYDPDNQRQRGAL